MHCGNLPYEKVKSKGEYFIKFFLFFFSSFNCSFLVYVWSTLKVAKTGKLVP